MTEYTRSTCPYCGVGCGVIIESDGERVLDVKGDPNHPANMGKLCSKGSTLALTATPLRYAQARAAYPAINGKRATWDAALNECVERFASIIDQHGPDSVAFYVSGQLLTEDYYVFNKLAKGLIGTNNIDTNSRLCMSSAVAGYKQTLGSDAPPACYDDVNHTDCIFIAGSNTAFAHPVLFRRIEEAKLKNPDLKIIVVDPRRTDTASYADMHLAILPGTDVMLFNAMLNVMLWEGLIEQKYIDAHTEGFASLRDSVREITPALAAPICGITKEQIVQAAHLFAKSKATLSLYCQGLNQSSSGTAKNAALINLHLATGQIGKPGAGPFSLTGQPNAMGGREVGGLANLLSAHRDMANAAHRAEVAQFWGVESVPDKPGKTAVELFSAVQSGDIKAVWIACTNPAQSMPDLASVHEALSKAEFVVVQEAYRNTATAAFAHVLLPATTWAEKDGTVTNSERCITRVNPAVKPFGEARHDWLIATQFAALLKARLKKSAPSFNYANAQQVWEEHRETTRGRDLDITGLSFAHLAEQPEQWPMPQGASHGQMRLYEDGVFPTTSGRAKFVATPYKGVAEEITARFPFRLTTGRMRDQWHAMSRTGTLGQLFGHVAEPALEMAATDLQSRGFSAGQLVNVSSKRGSQIVRVAVSEQMRAGQAHLAMHWGPEYLGGKSSFGVNGLTSPAFDPVSKQPELKHCAVRIEAIDLPFQLTALGWLKSETVLVAREQLRALGNNFDFVSCTPFGREQEGVLLRIASTFMLEAPAQRELIAQIRNLFAVDELSLIQYADAKRGMRREACLNDDALAYALLIGDQSSEVWIRDLLQAKGSAAGFGSMLLVSSKEPPKGFTAQGKVVCNCFGISETQIDSALNHVFSTRGSIRVNDEGLSASAALRGLQGQLPCGTSCGSCLPELKRFIVLKQSRAEEPLAGAVHV